MYKYRCSQSWPASHGQVRLLLNTNVLFTASVLYHFKSYLQYIPENPLCPGALFLVIHLACFSLSFLSSHQPFIQQIFNEHLLCAWCIPSTGDVLGNKEDEVFVPV